MKDNNLWAPWRIDYLRSLKEDEDGGVNEGEEECFLCRYRDEGEDQKNLVLRRGEKSLMVMNRFPYTAGHLLIAPYEHVGDLGDLADEVMLEMMQLCREGQKMLREVIRPHGFNVGINIGRCAGAGLPGHIHLHLVPRWDGDTNFMSVVGKMRVVSQALEALYVELVAVR